MRILRPVFLPLALVTLVLTLSACGFHLRNALTLPPNLGPVHIVSSDPYSRLARSVERALAAAGAEIADPDATDVATLNIQSERWAALPASLDAQGRARIYLQDAKADAAKAVPVTLYAARPGLEGRACTR